MEGKEIDQNIQLLLYRNEKLSKNCDDINIILHFTFTVCPQTTFHI